MSVCQIFISVSVKVSNFIISQVYYFEEDFDIDEYEKNSTSKILTVSGIFRGWDANDEREPKKELFCVCCRVFPRQKNY